MSKGYNQAIINDILHPPRGSHSSEPRLPKGAYLKIIPARYGQQYDRAVIFVKTKGRTGSAIRSAIAGKVLLVTWRPRYARVRRGFNR